jgi:hypothetical protein
MNLIQAQEFINYKAIIKDNNGNVVANTSVTVQFSIEKGEIAATTVFSETHTPTTNSNGLIILNIGAGAVISGAFNGINWENDNYFLNVKINIGNGLIDLGTTQFMSVPYALHAKSGGNLKIIDTNNIISRNAGIGSNGLSVNASNTPINGKNIFIGEDVGSNNGTNVVNDYEASSNTMIGQRSFINNTTGYSNTGIGRAIMHFNTTGYSNTVVGANSLIQNRTGNKNIVIGVQALEFMNGGSNNIAIGYLVGSGSQSGNNNIIIGGNIINLPDFIGSNQLDIGNLIYGVNLDGTDNTISTGNIGIAVKNPLEKLHVNGNIFANGYIKMEHSSNNNWITYIDNQDDYNFSFNGVLKAYINDSDGSYNIVSDRKLKHNIQVMDANIIDKVMQLKPVTYTYKKDASNKPQNGFIAQEVQQLFPELVSKKTVDNEEFLTLRYDAFGVLAIKTIQKQQKEINQLKTQISQLKKLEERILILEKK